MRFCSLARSCVVKLYSFFFFQAEDGIRDHCVTGVQTCALPISGDCSQVWRESAAEKSRSGVAAFTPYLRAVSGSTRLRCSTSARRASRMRSSALDRKSVVEGKRVDLGGRRIIKKKKKKE